LLLCAFARKKTLRVIPSECGGSAFSLSRRRKQIPRAKPALGMTRLNFFRSLFIRAILQVLIAAC
jgi:hypothetical protein